jgi:hypothetical protein
MFDLVRRGALRLMAEPAVGGYHLFLERVPERSGDLAADEQYFVDEFLFCQWPRAPRVSLPDVMIEGARRSREVCGRVEEWRRMAERGPLPFPFEDPASERASRLGIAVGIVMLGAAYAVGCLFESPLAVAAIVLGALMIAGNRLIRRRTPEAAEALARWTAFRRHLCTSGGARDQSLVPADTRWRYLTCAVTLGVAEHLIDQFRLLYPSHENVADSAAVYAKAFSPGSDLYSRTLVELAAGGAPGAAAEPD